MPSWRGVELKPVVPELFPFLYDMLVGQHEVGIRWRYRGATPSPEDFARNLTSSIYAHYVGVRSSTDEIVSYVSAYSANPRDAHCYVAVAVPDALRLRTGAGMISLGLLINSLFENAPFRKVYAEAPAFNMKQYRRAIGPIFEIEGCLTEHEWYQGAFHDVYTLALTRERWLGVRERYGLGRAARAASPIVGPEGHTEGDS